MFIEKIKKFHSAKLLKTVQHSSFLFLAYGLYLMARGELNPIPFLVATFLMNNLGASGALHRYFSHKSFNTNLFWHWMLVLWGTLSTQGSILHWVAMHRIHHKHSDSDLDPVAPKRIGTWRAFLGIIDDEQRKRVNDSLVKDLLADPVVVWSHDWYWFVIAGYVGLLVLIDPRLVLTCYLMPLGMVRFTFGVNNTVNHGAFSWLGYRNFESNDASTNSILFHVLSLFSGEALHNNHHYDSRYYSFTHKWWEVDPTALFIGAFMAKKQ